MQIRNICLFLTIQKHVFSFRQTCKSETYILFVLTVLKEVYKDKYAKLIKTQFYSHIFLTIKHTESSIQKLKKEKHNSRLSINKKGIEEKKQIMGAHLFSQGADEVVELFGERSSPSHLSPLSPTLRTQKPLSISLSISVGFVAAMTETVTATVMRFQRG